MKERKKELREHYKEDEEGKLRGEHVVVIFPPPDLHDLCLGTRVLCLYCVSACLCISEEEYTTLRVARTCLSASDAKRQNKKFRDGFEE